MSDALCWLQCDLHAFLKETYWEIVDWHAGKPESELTVNATALQLRKLADVVIGSLVILVLLFLLVNIDTLSLFCSVRVCVLRITLLFLFMLVSFVFLVHSVDKLLKSGDPFSNQVKILQQEPVALDGTPKYQLLHFVIVVASHRHVVYLSGLLLDLIFQDLQLVQGVDRRTQNEQQWTVTCGLFVESGKVEHRWLHESRVQDRAQEALNVSYYAFRSEDSNQAKLQQVLHHLLLLRYHLLLKPDTS